MKNVLKFSLFILGVIFISSCATQEPLYYWGNYQDTYYKNMKKADETAYDNHIATMDNILLLAEEKGTKVPPGVYAEYGYIKLKEGNVEEAKRFFELEMATYPQSIQLMKLLIDNL